MNCSNCGEQLPEAARFCRRCGVEISQQKDAAPSIAAVYGDRDASEAPRGAGDARGESIRIETRFVKQGGLSTALRVFLAISALVALLSIVASVRRIALANDGIAGRPVTLDQANNADLFVDATGGLQFVAIVVIGILFITWLFRATRNLRVIGVDLELGPRWAIGAWFIPLAGIWFSFRVVMQAWQASVLDPVRRERWRKAELPDLVVSWAIVWFLAGAVSGFGAFSGDGQDASWEDVRAADIAIIVSQAVLICAAALAFAIVHQLTARQQAIYRSLTAP